MHPRCSERKNVLRNFSAHIRSRAQVNWKGCNLVPRARARFRPAVATRPFLGADQKERSLWERDWKGCRSILLSLLSNGFCGKNAFFEYAIKSDRAFYQHRVRTRTKTGLGVQVPVHDYKHSKGTLLVTMLPELHLYLILSVFIITRQFIFGLSTTEIEIKFYSKNCSWSTDICSLDALFLVSKTKLRDE